MFVCMYACMSVMWIERNVYVCRHDTYMFCKFINSDSLAKLVCVCECVIVWKCVSCGFHLSLHRFFLLHTHPCILTPKHTHTWTSDIFHSHTHKYTHTHTRTRTHTHTHGNTADISHVHTYTHTRIHTHTHTYTHTHGHMIFSDSSTVETNIHTHKHTHTHKHSHSSSRAEHTLIPI